MYCDFQFELTRKQTVDVSFYTSYFKVFTPDGTSMEADKVSFAGNTLNTYRSNQEIIAGVPVKVQAYFNIPASTPMFRALEIDGKRLENVPIRSGAAARPGTPTTLPAPAVTGFDLQLSNCAVNRGVYTCTATLTPTK
ncbi:hypothetical protein [Deinococcus radiophilus]|uniref:Uncharacterized protein n=1 Tax=Deinococcus radiophilus TaxID=32062 RepID=A0A3S0RDN9_9DEIO|nr:hypothetical protein [Deinococcus radiophilus]RTR25787.1 hypothetical protein EJ104_09540 [Deinococcus radiophilus]UFA50830.1 hypothetical protein LMT64_02680 [Deinococcus radiophilus]